MQLDMPGLVYIPGRSAIFLRKGKQQELMGVGVKDWEERRENKCGQNVIDERISKK